MAEAGSFADRVKQQADIVRVVGEYLRRKQSDRPPGLCLFHNERRRRSGAGEAGFYHCFGLAWAWTSARCDGDGQDHISEAVRAVAKSAASRSAREKLAGGAPGNQLRSSLVELHKEAAAFFCSS
jgi:DNA primase